MKDDAHPTNHLHGQDNIQKPVTPEMRQQSTKDHRDQLDVDNLVTVQMRQELVRLIQQMAGCQEYLEFIIGKLELFKDAIARAGEAAESLLDDNALQALTAIKRIQQAAERKVREKADWDDL
jgi:hypothetical protein